MSKIYRFQVQASKTIDVEGFTDKEMARSIYRCKDCNKNLCVKCAKEHTKIHKNIIPIKEKT